MASDESVSMIYTAYLLQKHSMNTDCLKAFPRDCVAPRISSKDSISNNYKTLEYESLDMHIGKKKHIFSKMTKKIFFVDVQAYYKIHIFCSYKYVGWVGGCLGLTAL